MCASFLGVDFNFSRPIFSNSVWSQAVALALEIFHWYSMCAFGGWLGWLAFSRKSRNFFSNVCVVSEGWLHFSRPNFSNSVCFRGFALALDNFSRYSICAFGGWLGWLGFSRKARAKIFKCVRRFWGLTSFLEANFFKQCLVSSSCPSSRDFPLIQYVCFWWLTWLTCFLEKIENF